MVRFLPLLLFAACTPPATETVFSETGKRVDVTYLIMEPLCVALCSTSVTTSGVASQTQALGSGSATGPTTNTTQSVNSGIGGTGTQ